MAKSRKLTVMISSRCNDPFPNGDDEKSLSDIRKKLKKEILSQKLMGKEVFEVWINEDAPAEEGNEDSWDKCLAEVKDADILLVLSNGNAGWPGETGTIGICHAELFTGLNHAPSKVRLISLGNTPITDDEQGQRNQRFQSYIDTQNLFRGGKVPSNYEELKSVVFDTLHKAVVTLSQRGVISATKERFNVGEALNWNRMDFRNRQIQMVKSVTGAIRAMPKSAASGAETMVLLKSTKILFAVNAIPAAMSISAAREMVGQPFLRDHLLAPQIGKTDGGPVHIIACHRGATENQALKALGFPDATIVTGPFGVYVADSVQQIQFVLLANCRDESTTMHCVQRFFEWLRQSGEIDLMIDRARKRAKIVTTIHELLKRE